MTDTNKLKARIHLNLKADFSHFEDYPAKNLNDMTDDEREEFILEIKERFLEYLIEDRVFIEDGQWSVDIVAKPIDDDPQVLVGDKLVSLSELKP